VDDFASLARQERWAVERSFFLTGNRRVSILPNLTAETAVFLVKR
jgi:hypothetical protein